MPSGPGVFPFFNVIYSGLLISLFKGGFVVTFNSISAIGMFGRSTGGCGLRISLMCSSHLDPSSSSLFMVLPSLFMVLPSLFMVLPSLFMVLPSLFMVLPSLFMVFPSLLMVLPSLFMVLPSLFMVLPSLSFTGFEGSRLFSTSVLVMSYSSPVYLLCAAFSASVARSFITFCLSILNCFKSCQ